MLSCVRLFATPWTAAHQASLCFTVSRSLFKLVSIEFVMPSNHLILCHPLLLPPSILPSMGVFSNESTLPIRWPKYWSFSFSISLSNEYSGLIYSRMDWFGLDRKYPSHGPPPFLVRLESPPERRPLPPVRGPLAPWGLGCGEPPSQGGCWLVKGGLCWLQW